VQLQRGIINILAMACFQGLETCALEREIRPANGIVFAFAMIKSIRSTEH
jgi:hypothetical protein